MAFWGVEVKPGKPFTHSFESVRGRLRISQATLAIGSSTKKSLVQCNVGDKSPVLLCALLPDKTESCQLDLEFEEANEVVFSVIGPRSVHLTGYYVGNSRNSKLDDDSESYGEDIANTDTEECNQSGDDDEYEDSFINDDEPEVLPPSPVSSDGVQTVDEVVDIKKPREGKGVHKRLKKKYQSVDSDEETITRQQKDMNGTRGIQESESEDDIPISSIYNSKAVAKNMTEEKPNKEIVEHGDKMAEDGGTHSKKEDSGTHVIESKGKVDALAIDDDPKSSKEDQRCNSLPPSDEVGPQNRTKQKKKRKEKDNETATDRRSDLPHNSSMPPTTEIAPENGMKSKKKRKERSKEEKNLIADSEEVSENSTKAKKRRKERTREGKSHEDNSASRSSVLKEDQSKQDEVKDAGNMSKDVNVRNEQDQKPSSESIDIDSDQLASEKKNKKKRKKKNTILENDENVNVEVPLLPKEEKNRSMKESKEKNVVTMSSQARTLSNGLIIEDLESGKSNGKIAARGRKVKVHYIGKLKEDGRVIDSNIGKAPFKFRLGDQEIIEGWNLGLDGMRVGDKRRLLIPPTLGYGSQGTGENIPPNSWLLYDIELVAVH